MPENEERLKFTPGLPTYLQTCAFMRAVVGINPQDYSQMYKNIIDQAGNPQEIVDWSDPNTWINEKLGGNDRDLASKIWCETAGKVNPRHSRGCWYFIKNHELMRTNNTGTLVNTDKGIDFINNPIGNTVAQCDRNEGILNIIQLLIEHNPSRKSELLPEYSEFCRGFSTYQAQFLIGVSLFERITNLIDRGLIIRNGVRYEITEAAIAYNNNYSHLIIGRAVSTKQANIQRTIMEINNEAREKLKGKLAVIDPFKFEHLIKALLEAMNYTNVEVTSPRGDLGVDVVGDIELGISSIREVVQVKRHVASINRDTLDRLRGSLHRFGAMRGTIITTGKFARGTKDATLEMGAAPITLIDGEKLLDLLSQYEIGISKKKFEFYEYDESSLEGFFDQEDEEG